MRWDAEEQVGIEIRSKSRRNRMKIVDGNGREVMRGDRMGMGKNRGLGMGQ